MLVAKGLDRGGRRPISCAQQSLLPVTSSRVYSDVQQHGCMYDTHRYGLPCDAASASGWSCGLPPSRRHNQQQQIVPAGYKHPHHLSLDLLRKV